MWRVMWRSYPESSKMNTKSCTTCRRILPINCFSKCSSAKDGLQWMCKDCHKDYRENHKERRKNYRETHREQIREYDRERYEANKEQFRERAREYYKSHKEYCEEYYRKNKAKKEQAKKHS